MKMSLEGLNKNKGNMRGILGWTGLLMIAGIFTLISGCDKENGCKSVPVEDERAILEAFNASIGMNATRHSTGVYYEILEPGSDNKPKAASTIYVKYKGTLLNGTVFDQQTNPGRTGFVLNNLIDGWKVTIPYIGKGGSIRISVPSSLAYGCQGQPSANPPIAPNSPLYFEIELVDFF
jgi:FKBP-type peptidyl-prolyl cis-trans isomerase